MRKYEQEEYWLINLSATVVVLFLNSLLGNSLLPIYKWSEMINLLRSSTCKILFFFLGEYSVTFDLLGAHVKLVLSFCLMVTRFVYERIYLIGTEFALCFPYSWPLIINSCIATFYCSYHSLFSWWSKEETNENFAPVDSIVSHLCPLKHIHRQMKCLQKFQDLKHQMYLRPIVNFKPLSLTVGSLDSNFPYQQLTLKSAICFGFGICIFC